MATYEDGRIHGHQRGLIKDYESLMDTIKQLDGYLTEVNANISGGRRFELKREIDDLENQLEMQDQAKRYLAYQISTQISNLKSELDETPKDSIDELNRLLSNHGEKSSILVRKKKNFDERSVSSQHYKWLDAAVEEYSKLILMETQQKMQFKTIWMVLGIVSSIVSIFLVLNNQPAFGAGMIFLSLVFGFLLFQSIKKIPLNDMQKTERERIEQGFKNKFNDESEFEIAMLTSKRDELQPLFYSLTTITEDINTYTAELDLIEKDIQSCFNQLIGKSIDRCEWQSKLISLQEKRKKLDSEIHSAEIELSRLNVEEDQYIDSPIYVSDIAPNGEKRPDNKIILSYDPGKRRTIEESLSDKRIEMQLMEDTLQELKQKICGSTNSDINMDWEDLIEKLADKRTEKVNLYKQVTAEIISHIYLNETLDEFRAIENEKIDESLASEIVGKSLYSTTGHYERIDREGGDFYISDNFGRYKLSDLSTGAREQALLGLRIGFASKLLNENSLFLILDDAFQHSDWNRREMLVDFMGNLARKNWQIIYFTMDDHIKSLFNQRMKPQFEDAYRLIELND